MSLLENAIPKSSNLPRNVAKKRNSACPNNGNPKVRRAWQEGYSLNIGFNQNSRAKEKMVTPEESILLEHLAQGDATAFWQLWENHRRDLYGICLRQMGGVQEEAEDALSRVMLKAWDKLPDYASQIENLKAWLCRLAFNLCVDVHRERLRLRCFECLDNIVTTDFDPAVSRAISPEDLTIQREVSVCLFQAVGSLPLRLREPFILRFFYEAGYPEISQQLALSSANVRKRIQQARIILRERLSHHFAGSAE